MFKLVVLSALVAVAVAKPGYLGGVVAPVAYSSSVVASPVITRSVAVAPAAVSHTYREDVISKPAVISTYAHAAPVVKSIAYSAAPAVAYSAPAVAYSVPAVSYNAHVAAPVAYAAAPALSYAAHAPLVQAW